MRFEYREELVAVRSQSLVEHARGKLLYHELAPLFEELVDRDSDREADFIIEALSLSERGGGRLLDLGCGVGRILSRVTRRAPHVLGLGVDLSADVLSVAVSRYGLRTVRSDVRCLPFADATFDFAMCVWSTFNYLSVVADHELFFSECGRVLGSAGLLFIDSVWRPDGYLASERRSVSTADMEGELRIEKRVDDGLNVAVYEYELRNRRTGEKRTFVDQEVCRMYSVGDIVTAAQKYFVLVDAWTGYAKSIREDRELCLLRCR